MVQALTVPAHAGLLLEALDFRSIRSSEEYGDWVRFKMETIATLYEAYGTESIIGRPIDVFTVSPPFGV